jgi:RNA polymerase sigma-70 factor (ECF subfamily)
MLDDQEVKKLLLRTAVKDEGSAEAFEKLYKLCGPLLLGVAQRVLRRRELAEEALHDGFAKIWRAAESFDPYAAQPVAWLVTIVRNRAIDIQASHDVSKVDSYHDTLDADPEGALDRLFEWGPGSDENEDRRRAAVWVRSCLSKQQATERQSLVLAYEHGLSHGDLATHLQKPLGTVKTWVRRGMENLRQCVESLMRAAR